MRAIPYLRFDGTCEEAFSFYAEALGGSIARLSRWSEMPPSDHYPIPDDFKSKIMHARLESAAGTLMGSDLQPSEKKESGNVTLCLEFDDVSKGESIFNELSAGGSVEMPLMDMFWGAKFGQFRDRYGIDWMVNIELAKVTP